MHNPESVLENEMHKLLWDFDIQTDHLNFGQTTRPYNNQQKKRTCWIVNFVVSAKSRGRKLGDEMERGKKNSHGTLID